MLADEILATIMERPGISAPEIRAAFPTITRNCVASAIGRLREDGRIENAGRGGTYRAAETKAPEPAPARRPMPLQSSITPASLARLMAGR
jgi:DNA-binding FadR family transcriptional regulator